MTKARSASPGRCAWGVLAALAVLFGCLESIGAADALVRQERLVHRFDFEETDDRGNLLGRGHQWPPHWFGIGRPPGTSDPAFLRQPLHRQLIEAAGHPRYTQLGYDSRHVTSGEFSFHIGLDGGNAGAFLEVGAVPAVPGSDYLITANVRTEQLELARGQLIAYFIDGSGNRIDASIEQTAALRTGDEWTSVAVKLTGDFDRAAWIGLELALRQPAADPTHPLGAQQIVLEDVRGEIWFDDISIWQVPHVSVRTQSDVNLIHAPDAPRVEARVRDLSGRRLTATLSAYDHRMTPVDQARFTIGQGAPMQWRWEPELPALGWYLVDLTIYDRAEDADDTAATGQPIARTIGALLWMPEHGRLHERDQSRFALPAEEMPARQWDLLPELLRATGIQRTTVSIWSRQTRLDNIEQRVERIDGLLQQVYANRGDLMLSLHPVPNELVERDGVDTRRPIEMLQSPADQWQPYLWPILLRHGPRVRQWVLGLPRDAVGVFDAELPRVLRRISDGMHRVAPQPRLIVPWRLDHARREDMDAASTPSSLAMDIDVPPDIAPMHLPDYLAQWESPAVDHRLSLRTRPADEMSHARRVTDLTLRMVHAWRVMPDALQLRRPWTAAPQNEAAVLPDPLLGVFANVAHQLAGRRVVGELSLHKGLRCFILDGPAGGALVAWNVSAPEASAHLAMYLGRNPVARDVWGNSEPVALGEHGVHRVELDATPKFITGIDPELALFRAGFRVDPPLVESLQMPHHHTIELTNPWQRTVSGQMRIVGPEGWQYQPSQHFFSIPAGDSITLPLGLQFPIAEVAGPKALRAQFEFTAEHEYDIEMSAPMELGLPDIDFDATVALEAGDDTGARDAVVTCIIINRGDGNQALYVFANLVGHARQERLIARLEPGQSVVRRFRFEDAADDVRRHAIRAGVRETAGPAILNYRLTPDDGL